MSSLRHLLVMSVQGMAWLILMPLIVWSKLPLPEYSRFTAPGQLLSIIPGFTGILLRRVWYRSTLRECGSHLTVDWLAVIRTQETIVGNNCTFGVASWINLATVGDNVMTGSHVIILSGRSQHGFDRTDQPMRLQHGQKERLKIDSDVWIGARAIIMADVAGGTVIGAGSVVNRTFPPRSVVVGNPARLLRSRENASSAKTGVR